MDTIKIEQSDMPTEAAEAIAAITAWAEDRCDECGVSHHIDKPDTISSGWSGDLVYDDGGLRVWLDRTGEDTDGPAPVEVLREGRWMKARVV